MSEYLAKVLVACDPKTNPAAGAFSKALSQTCESSLKLLVGIGSLCADVIGWFCEPEVSCEPQRKNFHKRRHGKKRGKRVRVTEYTTSSGKHVRKVQTTWFE